MQRFHELLKEDRPLLIDGAMGTMLQARGLSAGQSPEDFCLENPDVLRAIHKDYVDAGADIILTCTFGGSRFKLPKNIDVFEFNKKMAEIAKQAANNSDRKILVGGDIGPSGYFPKPLGEVEPMELYEAYREQARALAAGGVDLIFIETQFDLAEARLAVAATREACDLPIAVSMTFEDGLSLTGSSPEIFAHTMTNMGVDAIGVNCGAGPEQMLEVVARLQATTYIPVFAEPNAGLPELVGNDTVFRLEPEPFAKKCVSLLECGLKMIGGCCGTSPKHINELSKIICNFTPPTKQNTNSGIVLTTRSSLVKLGANQAIQIIGERINPTGKKALQAELLAGQFDIAFNFAKEQIAAGAKILDVNVGAPMVDETIILPQLVSNLVGRHSEVLALDSSNPLAIEKALPYLPGSGLVNSISGEHDRIETLGPLCKNWGAPFVLLPIKGHDLPVMASQRIAIIEQILTQAESLGIGRHLVLVDVLALSVASSPEAGYEALKTIQWCKENGLACAIGLSNISFGLPARELINSNFLSMCAGFGLSACIANPSSARINQAIASANVLMGYDEGASFFIENYSNFQVGAETNQKTANAAKLELNLENAVILGEQDKIIALVEQALENGEQPFEIVNQKLIPAITEVGNKYEKREYFLPQLLRSAKTMQTAFAKLKPLLEEAKEGAEKQPVIILATVEGDIHDIGKNIVGLMLSNHGFEVIDLGKDVKACDIVDAAKKHEASIIGLSALMTTTMIKMQDTVDLVKEQGLDIKVIIGGAVVTDSFAKRINADAYSTDAAHAVRVAKELLS